MNGNSVTSQMHLHQELYRILHILLRISNHCMWNRNSRLLDYTVMEMTEGVTVQNSYDFPPLNPFYVTNFRKSYFTQAGNYLTVSTASPKKDFSYLSTVWCHIRGERTGRSVFVLHISTVCLWLRHVVCPGLNTRWIPPLWLNTDFFFFCYLWGSFH